MPSSAAIADRLRLPGHRARQSDVRHLAFVALSLAALAAAYLGTVESTPLATASVLVVTAALGMQARLAKGRLQAAAQVAASAALLVALGAAPRLVVTALAAGLVGTELIAHCTGRSSVLQAGLWTGILASAASLLALATPAPPPGDVLLREALGAFGGGLLSAPVMLTLGPVAERLFGHTTRLTMGEWLSYEHPLLRQLAARAPGTFQHSVNVGVLADAAAGAIGGDALLARVGGLYHDVGKTKAPEYFVENQQGPNPHDDLDPRESARILQAHVTDGVELVRMYRMGSRIADFVREHHGTSVMRLFREKAEKQGIAGATDDDAYRYEGPRPRSRETAIVMISDQIEATARSAPPPDEAGCAKIVQRTIGRVRDERQLDESGMSPQDLAAIAPALSRAVQAMYHRRMAYPTSGTGPVSRSPFAVLTRALTRRRGPA